MARTRNIKPAFFDNEILGSIDPLARLLFIGLWTIADREGRLEDRPRKIKKTLLGYDDVTAEETSGMLQQLADGGFLIRYEVEGERYIQVVNFTKHQNPHMKEKESEIPPPPGWEEEAPTQHQTSTRQAPDKDDDDDPEEKVEEKPNLQERRFEEFWNAYPNKKAKANAKRAWMKIRPTEVLFSKIMTAIEAAKRSEDWQKENGRFIPHPATWLNGGRWEDEIQSSRPSHQSNGKTDTMGVLAGIIADEEGGDTI